jgi:hypothetical protein
MVTNFTGADDGIEVLEEVEFNAVKTIRCTIHLTDMEGLNFSKIERWDMVSLIHTVEYNKIL